MKFEKWLFVGLVGISIAGVSYAVKNSSGEMTESEAEKSKRIMGAVNSTGKLFISDEETKKMGDTVTEIAKTGFDYLSKSKS